MRPTTAPPVTEGMGDAREDLAARLERLARLVRASPIQDPTVFDEAYAAVGHLSHAMRAIWQPLATPRP